MRWVLQFFNKIFRNLYISFAYFTLFMLFIVFVAVSAQYIGNGISQKILNNSSIDMLFFINDKDDNKEIYKVMTLLKKSSNLSSLKLKIKKIDINDRSFLTKKQPKIIISSDQNFMEELSQNNKLSTLERGIFSKSKQHTSYYKYDEYAKITTNFDDIKLYVGYVINEQHNNEKNKILNTFLNLNSVLLKQDFEDPNEEQFFEKK